RRADAAVETPAVERGDAFLQLRVLFRLGGQRLEFRNQIEHRLRAVPDVFINILRWREREILREVADDQIAPARDAAAIRRLLASENLQKGRFARTIAPHQSDVCALANRERSAVEDNLLVVAHNQV